MFDFGLLADAAPSLLWGLVTTIFVACSSFSIACILGCLLGAVSLSPCWQIARSASAYTQIARATPEIIAIFWGYYCLPIVIGVNLSGLTCGILALGLIGGGYVAEIARGGILSIDRGQWEAASSLSLPRHILWTRVIMPQAVKLMLPALVNYLTDNLKATTLLAGIGVSEVVYAAYISGSSSYRYLEPLTGVAILFFLLIFPLSLVARRLGHRRGQKA